MPTLNVMTHTVAGSHMGPHLAEFQKRKKLAPANFLTQKINTKTRDLCHFQICDKIA